MIINCPNCNVDFDRVAKHQVFCTTKCRMKSQKLRSKRDGTKEEREKAAKSYANALANKEKAEYTSSNIKAIEPLYNPTFDWKSIAEIAHEHNKPIEWVDRGFRACRLAGVCPSYFVRKYILREPNMDIDEAVQRASKDVQKEDYG